MRRSIYYIEDGDFHLRAVRAIIRKVECGSRFEKIAHACFKQIDILLKMSRGICFRKFSSARGTILSIFRADFGTRTEKGCPPLA